MYRTNARVKGGRLYQSQTESHPIVVGTPAWFDWLEQHRAFLFVDRTGRFTAYKSGTDPYGQSWEAACTRNGKRSRIQLGQSYSLTLKRLHTAARMLAVEFALFEPTEIGHVSSADSKSNLRKVKACVPRSLIHTKLYRPRGGSNVIERVRLMERLNAALCGKATLVCAPAGFGKTTLMGEWVQMIERPSAWLTLDEHDNELAIFVSSLVVALQTVFPGMIHSTRKTIQVLALQAWANDLQGCEMEALVAIERALVLARPGGFIRTFADLPALFPILQKLRTRQRNQHTVDQIAAYLKRILVAMNPEAARALFREELRRQEGLEP